MIEINNLFPVPKGIVDVRNKEGVFTGAVVNVDEIPIDFEDVGESLPATPTDFVIVSQVIRNLSDGTSVADVTISFPGNPENYEYEVRIAPA